MKTKSNMCFFLTILSILILSSCSYHHKSNDFTTTGKQSGVAQYLAISEKGIPIVLDTNGKQILPCVQQNIGTRYSNKHSSSEPCKTQIIERDGKTIVIKDGEEKEVLYDLHIRKIGYRGTNCETTVLGVTQYEGCYPFPHP